MRAETPIVLQGRRSRAEHRALQKCSIGYEADDMPGGIATNLRFNDKRECERLRAVHNRRKSIQEQFGADPYGENSMQSLRSFSFSVCGHEPIAQPRPRATWRNGKVHLYTDEKRVGPWKEAVSLAARPCLPAHPLDIGVRVEIHFFMVRPKDHYTANDRLKPIKKRAPDKEDHWGKPDLDNLAKPILDELTEAGMWLDDSQVIDLRVSKRWANKTPGCAVYVDVVV